MQQKQITFEAEKGIQIENIPKELQQLQQWVMWRFEEKERKGKPTKVPYFSVSQKANTTDPKTWLKFHEAINFLKNDFFHGIGFVFTEEDEYVGIDIDNCANEDGLKDDVNEIASLMKSYTEYSPSGTGLHIIVKVDQEFKFDSRKDSMTGIEIYQKGRYFTFTGKVLSDSEIQYRDQEVQTLLDEYLHPSSTEQFDLVPIEELQKYTSNKDDQIILQELFSSEMLMPNSSMTFGHYNKFLFENGHQGNRSSDDWYFAKQLAFLCSGDIGQMNRIFMNSALYRPEKWDKVHYSNGDTYGQRTLYNAVCAKKTEIDKRKNIIGTTFSFENGNQFLVPYGYCVKNGALYQVIEKELRDENIERKEMLICRQAPIITRSFMNAEYPQLYHELSWSDKGKVYKEVIPAGDLAIKKELLKLSYKSLAVTDNNAKHLITYFDRLNMINNLDHEHLVERLGHIKNTFIHPLTAAGVTVLPPDIGERQLLEAFQISGTSEEWIEHVFKPIKKHPKALLMVLASFTSVLLQDLKMKPFIIDLSGVTSQGKTTVLRACASVWGTEHLVSEWNLTKVAAERKASFLNSFPLILDDTRKADEKQLQGFVYNFSGGRSKGRGSVSGSQREFTWGNLMLSTGEDSLNSYAERAGGVAARILPITGLPFESENYQFFNDLYNSIENYYGSIGLDFLNHWQEKKNSVLPYFSEYNNVFQKKSQGNEVISRIARYYAAIVFTGRLLNEFFNLEIDLMQLYHLFDELNAENKAVDKPMQLLEAILSDLDADRGAVYGEYLPHGMIKAVYKNRTIYLLPSYLKDFLKAEQNTIRNEWLRRGICIESINNGTVVDYQQIKHKGRKFRGVAIQPNIVEELGFNFDEKD